MTPLKAIHAKCLECAGSHKAVRNCETAECPLFSFRAGRNPHRKDIGCIANLSSRNSRLSGSFLTKKGIVENDGNVVLAIEQKVKV